MGKEHLIQWQPGQSGNPNGRPKKIYTILKEKGYSKSDTVAAFKELSWYTVPELKEVANDDAKPIIVRIVARVLFKALQKSDWTKIKEIMEHTIGKPTQRVEMDTGLSTSDMSREQVEKELADRGYMKAV